MVKLTRVISILVISFYSFQCQSQNKTKFKAIGFFTALKDQAHISFVHEANGWFSNIARQNDFVYDSTNNWNNLNPEFLSGYQLIIFLDTRPETPEQRIAFENFMKKGGAWMGFHFAGFALTPSTYPQNWDWYHNEFLGAGQYKGNTWRPVPAVLRVEHGKHPAAKHLPETFQSAPNEWYSWEKDLRTNPNIEILLSIDPTSYPVGTGPKPHEIWHSGYYPVAWTNKNYRMIYFNMGHNDMDYEHKTNKQLSSTFSSSSQNQLIVDALLWLGGTL